MPIWHLITAEYPPTAGGVGDYSKIVAEGLSSAGDEVHVWTPAAATARSARDGIELHELPGHFGPSALAALSRGLSGVNADRILVQYVPHAFGLKAMNLPFCVWLAGNRHRNIFAMFHEVYYPFGGRQPIRHDLLAVVTRVMAAIVARSATKIFISALAWERLLLRLLPTGRAVTWLPVPSTIPVLDDPGAANEIKSRYAAGGSLLLGHFGTYAAPLANTLAATLAIAMREKPALCVLLMGRNGGEFHAGFARAHPELANRIHSTGTLEADALSLHLSASDLMLQPYPDGVSTRRTSMMAVLAHSRPTITTLGDLTERLWTEDGAVALAPAGDAAGLAAEIARLAADGPGLQRLGMTASEFYRRRFDIKHTIGALRSA
ncbi:MAG TPA: glycosyltransferase [Candidatus Binataceae bacterium]